ncbi:hypothetical protein TrVE_jg14353 [Triparma verrucosa]|uniref:Protein kinase domain-containing protein n=1 Tax=Triparma verrucosa TaxID=1606542 RepID=A0A9W7CII6_9STRA|nr:hypothetical protein TrVE_jg14353 [Triparma verrucosa]
MEFVPGVGLANTAPPAAPQHTQSFGSLSTAAASYTPGQAFQPPSTQEYGAAQQQHQQQYAAQQQQQVQPQSTLVSRNGQQFRVPTGLAGQYNPADQAQYDSVVGGIRGGEGSGFDGHDAEGWTWSNAATTHPHPLGIPPSLHSHYQTLTNLQSRTLPPSSHHYKSIPPKYHSAYPLSLGQESGSYGYPSSLFSVRSRDAEGWFVLRRFDVKCSPKIASACITAFRALRSPFCVALKSCFVSNRALFFLHDYLPGCATMYDLYFEKQTSLSERTLWSYIVQLLLGVKSVHGSGLAVRCLKVKRVLITRDSKLKIGGLGIVDVLEFEDRKRLEDLRREDLKDVGRVILSVGSRLEVDKSTSPEVVKKAIESFGQLYSPEMCSLVIGLVGGRGESVYDVVAGLGHRIGDEVEARTDVCEGLDRCLAKEYESGRSARLLMKMNMVLERPEMSVDKRWSETGDRYVLKLFRDYVFHQCDGNGEPVMDLGHVVSCMNKLDAGDMEEVCLSSRDGQAVLVVSYGDVGRCLEAAYEEMLGRSAPKGVERVNSY